MIGCWSWVWGGCRGVHDPSQDRFAVLVACDDVVLAVDDLAADDLLVAEQTLDVCVVQHTH